MEPGTHGHDGSDRAEADREIGELAAKLESLQEHLGDAYWSSDHVRTLQARLRSRIGAYASWSTDKLSMHQRARWAARYESGLAHLLWPR